MKNVIFLTGYYGSGKTEIALNLALKYRVDYLVDLDIINPYFRSREAKDLLGENIEIISSDLEKGTYADLPYLSKKIFMPFRREGAIAIYDLGGNDLGAKVMRQFEQEDKNLVDLFLVLNVFREETKDAQAILGLIEQIERSSGFKITGLINNTNLLRETTYDDIFFGEAIIDEVSKKSGIPIVYTSVYEEIYDKNKSVAGEALVLKLYFRKKWY